MLESDLLHHEVDRYSRQVIVQGVKIEGQKKIRESKVVIIGCGGLGIPVIMYLAACGVGIIGLVDFDRVELHNLQRQIIYKTSDVSKLKVEVAAQFVAALNPTIKVKVYDLCLDAGNVGDICGEYDYVTDCCDDLNARYIISDYCSVNRKSLVSASVLKWEGQVYVLSPDGPCYRCLYPDGKSKPQNCAEAGVMGSVCGIIGSIQATEVIKMILGNSESYMIIYDAYRCKQVRIEMRKKQNNCTACINGQISNKNMIRLEAVGAKSCVPKITWEELLRRSEEYLIVDIRAPIQYQILRFKNSVNMPYNEGFQINKLFGKKIALICKKGITALKVQEILNGSNVESYVVEGGITQLEVLSKESHSL